MLRRKLGAIACAGVLALGGVGMVACDEEDERDAEELGEDIQEGVEEGAEEVEEEVDENIDTDGTDDQ